MKKIGVIGCGRWGRNIARNVALAARAHARYFCDIDEAALRDLKERYGYVNVTTDYRDVLSDHDLDAVFVATPDASHAAIAVAAMAAGKDVYLEAPMASTPEEADAIVAAAERTGRRLMVGHLHRHNPILSSLRQILSEPATGAIRYFFAQRFNLIRPPEAGLRGEDMIFAFAHHDLYAMSFLAGSSPVDVEARSYALASDRRADVITIALGFPRNVRGHIHISALAPLKERKLTVVGDNRMIVYDEVSMEARVRIYEIDDPDIFVDRCRPDSFSDFQQIQRSGRLIVPNVIAREPLAMAVEHFVRVLEGEAEPSTDAAAGAEMVRELHTISKSAALKIELSF